MSKVVYKNETITHSVEPDNLLTGMTVGTLQEDFPLNEGDFLRLKMNQVATTTWAVNFLFATIGYGISIVPKWLSELAGQPNQVSQAEWMTLLFGVVIALIIYGIGFLLPNERKSTMKKIEQHFNNAPKSRQVIRR